MNGDTAITRQLEAAAELHRILQDNLSAAMVGILPPGSGEFAADTYELGISCGAAEVLRYSIPLLAEVVDGNPWADDRLRVLLSDLRSALGELVGDETGVLS